MPKKPDDNRVGGVKSTKHTTGVEETAPVSGVTEVKPTAPISGVRGPGGIDKRRPTRTMSVSERDEIFKIINEEADKLFEGSPLSAKRKELVKGAVKMAVDAGLIADKDEEPEKEKGK